MKLTPEDLARIEDKKVANILRKIYTEKRTPTAREDAILQRAGIQASGNEALTGYVGTWDDLATALGVTRRAIQDWRNDPRYKPVLAERSKLLERADGRHCVAEWLRFMVDLNLKRGAAAADIEIVPGEDDECGGMIKPPPVGGSQAQWNVAIAALDHRKKANAIGVQEGRLLVAAELEVPLGAMLATFQTKGAAFPSRVARHLVGLREIGEIEDKLREELDADFADLQFASYLAEDALAAAVAAVPFDDATKALCEKLLFDGADRTALMALAGALATEALRQLGGCAIARSHNAEHGGRARSAVPPDEKSGPPGAHPPSTPPPAKPAKQAAANLRKGGKGKPRAEPATGTAEVEAAAPNPPRYKKPRRRG